MEGPHTCEIKGVVERIHGRVRNGPVKSRMCSIFGRVGENVLVMLVDSGRFHSFLNTEVAQSWEGLQP